MNYHEKAMAYKLLDRIPFGNQIYYYLQSNVTKSIQLRDDDFLETCNEKVQNFIEPLLRIRGGDLTDLKIYEFGAGWNLILPVLFSCWGNCKEYTAVDLSNLLHEDTFQNMVNLFERHKSDIGKYTKTMCKENIDFTSCMTSIKERGVQDVLNKFFNIQYIAPFDARKTGFENECLDVVLSCAVLEHVPFQDIKSILIESYRTLKNNGIAIHEIDYRDHYSYSDRKISEYNFLKFSDREWKKYNSSFQFQNRMRHSDYLNLFRECGFQVLQEKCIYGTENDIQALKEMQLSNRFTKYALKDLAIKGSVIILQKIDSREGEDHN